MKIAIITASSVTKGIITIAKWFGLTMSAYGPREIDEAIAFLQLSSEEQRTVQTEIFPLLQLVPCSVCEAVPWPTKR